MAVVQQIKIPLLSVNDSALTLLENVFQNGEFVKEGEIILIFESSKTSYEFPAEAEGYIRYLGKHGLDYQVNEVVATLFTSKEEALVNLSGSHEPPPAIVSEVSKVSHTDWTGQTLFSNAAKSLIASHGLDPVIFKNSDFINGADIESYLGIKQSGDSVKPLIKERNYKTAALLPSAGFSNIIIEKLTSGKKREIAYLSDVQAAGLTSTISMYVATDKLIPSLDQSLTALKGSLLPVVVYEVARLLHKYKNLNAYYSDDGICFYKTVVVGFAIDIDKGLKVLAVGDADKKTIRDVEQEILNLSGKYLDDKLLPGDLNDVGFTITDLSSENIAFFQPLVNRMNSAILGISGIDTQLNRITFSVTFDHRVTEGKHVSQFLGELKDRIESYRSNILPALIDIQCFKCLKTLQEDLSDTGFTRCISPAGADALICQSCLKGF